MRLQVSLSPEEISRIVTTEVEKAARAASGTRDVPQSRLDGRMIHLEWLGQTRSFAILNEASAEWLRARLASALTSMFVSGMQPKH